jgi:hypothetical protein
MRLFPLFQGSRPGLFIDLSAVEFCPLRIPLVKLGAAVSPTDKSRKGRRPPASHIRKVLMPLIDIAHYLEWRNLFEQTFHHWT